MFDFLFLPRKNMDIFFDELRRNSKDQLRRSHYVLYLYILPCICVSFSGDVLWTFLRP